MNLLFPIYLLGVLSIAVPIYLHLRNRSPKDRVPFSSHLFLEKTPEQRTRKTRLDQLLLLALRCLALLLLALAFARPYLNNEAFGDKKSNQTRALILIDRSASMQREDLWEQAIALAGKQIDRFNAGDQLAIATFDESLKILHGFDQSAAQNKSARKAALKQRSVKPGWHASKLGDALLEGAELLLSESDKESRETLELIVISDFQEGADLSSIQSQAWPPGVSLRPRSVSPSEPGNLTIDLAASPARTRPDADEIYRVRVRNAADSDFSSATIQWKGFPKTAQALEVAPGTSLIVSSAPRPAKATKGVIEVVGDKHPFDNEAYVAPLHARPMRIHYLAEGGISEQPGSPYFYLKQALNPTPTLTPILSASDSLDARQLKGIDIVVVDGNWSDQTAKTLQNFAKSGGLVIASPPENPRQDLVAQLTGKKEWKIQEATPNSFALLFDLDFKHPILQPFARAQIQDFTNIRFWKHRQLNAAKPLSQEEGVDVLATFDGKSPALMETSVGNGSIFLILSSWEPSQSQLALSSKFVPLLYSIFEHAGFSLRSAPTLYVGETDHPRPGFYPSTQPDAPPLIAVNLAPKEGFTERFDPSVVFPPLGIPLATDTAKPKDTPATQEERERLKAHQIEENQQGWKWVILAMMILLIGESWIANRGFRRKREPRNQDRTSPLRDVTNPPQPS